MTGFGQQPREIVGGLRTVPTEMETQSTFDCRGNQGWAFTSSKLEGSDRQQKRDPWLHKKDMTIGTDVGP